MLSFIYHLLTRARRRDEVTLDMIGTFEEARADARNCGVWSYFSFAMREIGGLLASPGGFVPKNFWTLVGGWGMAGLALGAGAWYLWPASYTSESVLLVEAPRIPLSFLGGSDAFDLERSFLELKQQVLSSSRVLHVVEGFGLYPHFRARNKSEDVVKRIREAVTLERTGNTIRVAFTYEDYPPAPSDPAKAAEVANSFASSLMEKHLMQREHQVEGTIDFFKSRADEAARRWERLNGEIRALNAGNPRFDRLALDRELTRKDYESLQQKVGEAEGIEDLERRQMGWKLTDLDPARVPEGPDISRLQVELYGLGCGLLVGFLAWLWSAVRSDPTAILAPEPSPGD